MGMQCRNTKCLLTRSLHLEQSLAGASALVECRKQELGSDWKDGLAYNLSSSESVPIHAVHAN